jgi:repressor LexA
MPDPLTDLERDVLDYLVEYVRDHTYQPSVREIGATFGIRSTKSVSELLQALADKGWIERDPSRSRGVRLLGLDLRAQGITVPHVDVHMTDPVLRDPLDSLVLDRRIVGSTGCFMISMVGNTMRDYGIRDGDLLVVEPVRGEDLEEGDLVAARIAAETSVRRLVRSQAGLLLDSGRLDLPPVPLAAGTDVMGRVVAVVRRLRTDAPAGIAGQERAREGAVAP